MVDHEAKSEQDKQEYWEEMYASHMGVSSEEAFVPRDDEHESQDEDGDDDEESGEESRDAEEETKCAECGHGSGAYPDEALDEFTLNYDEETVHYGCK